MREKEYRTQTSQTRNTHDVFVEQFALQCSCVKYTVYRVDQNKITSLMKTKPHTVYGGKLERSDVTGGGEGSEAAADSRVG